MSKRTSITDLRIAWTGARVLPGREKALGALLKEHGLERWASGYHFEDKKRDIAYQPIQQD